MSVKTPPEDLFRASGHIFKESKIEMSLAPQIHYDLTRFQSNQEFSPFSRIATSRPAPPTASTATGAAAPIGNSPNLGAGGAKRLRNGNIRQLPTITRK
jgi:hypothetical protein